MHHARHRATPHSPPTLSRRRLLGAGGLGIAAPGAGALKASNFVLADLTPLHSASSPAFTGNDHHSDIYRTEVYRLIAALL